MVRLTLTYPCADCGIRLSADKLGWCDHEDSEYYCPTCWDDDTATLPPPPAEMVAEAEKENQKYIHELFAKVLTIPEAQPIRRAIDKVVHAHPCAKMMDELIAKYWKPSKIVRHDKGGRHLEHAIKRAYAIDRSVYQRTSPYEKEMWKETDVWCIKKLFGRPFYLFDRDEKFQFKGLIAYPYEPEFRENAGSIKNHQALFRICLEATKTLKGKTKCSRARDLTNLLMKFQRKEGMTFDHIVKTFKTKKYNLRKASRTLFIETIPRNWDIEFYPGF